jgi:PAS domain S-box-containing protein
MSLVGSHDSVLVILSIVIATFASFTALSLGTRIRATTGLARRVWIGAASVALGGGIWAMHFVAMLAFSMPGMIPTYEVGLTLLSLALAIAFTGAGFALMGWEGKPAWRVPVAGLLMGTGVLAMHYVGMAAMRMDASLSYDRLWLTISALVAVGAASAAVWLSSLDHKFSHRAAASAFMGAAIAGMHFSGMKAAVFTARAGFDMAEGQSSPAHVYLAVAISGITLLILLLALGAARLERLLEASARRQARTELRLKVADVLRDRDTDKALAEMVALLGQHFGVSRTGYGQLDPVEEVFDLDVCWTDGTVPPLVGRFKASDFGARIVAELGAGRTIAIEDLLTSDLSDEEPARATARKQDTRAVLVVPFVRDGRLSTILYLNSRSPRRWAADDIQFMEEMAERTRLVFERAMVEAELRELNATLEERVEARTAELRAAEEARRQTDALYRAYFENAPDPLFVIRVEEGSRFIVEQVNPAHEAGVGFKIADIAGKAIEEVLPPELAEQVLAIYRHVVATGETHHFRDVFNLNGELQHWDTTLVPLRNEEGEIVRLIGTSRNVTRQVVAEEALRQSQKMEAMGQLTGGVAHDFNNLLTPIVGALDLLQRKGLGGEREQRLVQGAAQSAERAKVLVQRLLAFARRQPLRAVAVDIPQLVEGMGDLIASTTGPQIAVKVKVADDLPPATADPNQLEMALLNLSVNARDAMPEGGTLVISASRETVEAGDPSGMAPGTYVALSVADTGVGMDEATLARAIEPFFSTKGIGRGTGLGLSMVHGLALQLGGGLRIDSKPGEGTRVTLLLPASSEAPQQDSAGQVPAEAQPARGRILLVDDEDLVRATTADMLGELGYEVVEAASARDALEILDGGEAFDVLVTDHLMPAMSGTELARELASREVRTPVLIVSGYAEDEGIPADLPRLSKPFRAEELLASLRALA